MNNHLQEVMACMAYISFVMNTSALTAPPPPRPAPIYAEADVLCLR